MKMYIKSVMVEDQAKALDFYTNTLGFVVKHNIAMGDHSWITVVSPDEPDGVELGLEPNAHPAAKVFMAAMVEDGIPFTAFRVDDIEAEVARLTAMGVEFTQPIFDAGTANIAVFDDTVGNLIQLIELKEGA